MRICHAAIFSPNRCGLYETARELITAERKLGVDARLVDPLPKKEFPVPESGEDRGAPIADMEWAKTADVVINHSGTDNTPLAKTDQPVLHIAHGRPLSTFMGERGGGAPGLTWQTQRRSDSRYIGAVTLWPEYEPYLRAIWRPKPVFVVPPTVDLDYWAPGSSSFDFYGRRADVNVIMTDPWSREDAQPYHCIHAFALFKSIVPNARLHMFAWDGNKKALTGIVNLLGDGGGMITRWVLNMRDVMRAADMLITANRIYTRSIREAMACGLQVVSGRDHHPEDIEAFALTMARRLERPEPTRKMAEALFDPDVAAKNLLNIIKTELARVA